MTWNNVFFCLGQNISKFRSYMLIFFMILVTKYNWFPCDWRFECAEVGTEEILHNSVLQSSSRRGKATSAQGRSWHGLLSAQQICLTHKSRANYNSARQVLQHWSRWDKRCSPDLLEKMAGRKEEEQKCPARESTVEKNGVLILVKNSPGVSTVFLPWRDGLCQQYDTQPTLLLPHQLYACSIASAPFRWLSRLAGFSFRYSLSSSICLLSA